MKPEEAHPIIMKIYQELLMRKPDQGGYINYFNALVHGGKSEEWMLNNVASSKERRDVIAREIVLKKIAEMKEKEKEEKKKRDEENRRKRRERKKAEAERKKRQEEERRRRTEEERRRREEIIGMMAEDKDEYQCDPEQVTIKQRELIIGGMTTIPSRINDLKVTIDSIKKQTIPISKLILTIPYALRRNGRTYDIPQWIQEDNFIHILRMDDFGPVCKLLGPLEYSRDPETLIITFDDDTIYSDDTVKNLINGYLVYPNAAFATSSLLFKIKDNTPQFKTQYIAGPTNILEGWGGALYKRSFFHKDMHDMLPNSYHCFFSDDLIISNYLKKHGVPLIKVKKPRSLGVRGISNVDALRTGANGLTYRTFNRYRLAVMELTYLKKLYL